MNAWRHIEQDLAALGDVRVTLDEPMSRHTSLGVGGPADVFARVGTLKALEAVVVLLEREGCPWLALGAGTNLLVTDGGIEGVVVTLEGEFKDCRFKDAGGREGPFVVAGAAARLPRLLLDIERAGFGGLEYATGVPGSVGGAVVMNAGTSHGTVERSLVSVRWVLPAGVEEVPASRLRLGYRRSDIPARAVIASARFALTRGRSEDQARVADEIRRHRRERQPAMRGTAGSFFQNPDTGAGVFAGRLIEEAGLKGTRVGGAFVSPVHANFLTNGGEASARDLLELAIRVRNDVLRRSGVALRPEVRIVGRGAGEWVRRFEDSAMQGSVAPPGVKKGHGGILRPPKGRPAGAQRPEGRERSAGRGVAEARRKARRAGGEGR